MRVPAGGGLARVQGWVEAGLVSPILPLPEQPLSSLATPVPTGRHSWAVGPAAGA